MYITQTFDVVTFDQAKNVVLSTDPKDPEKFDRETNFLVDVIKRQNIITQDSQVLDFGCGMGRVSKQIIKQFNCSVYGMDISPSMKRFAWIYVSEPNKFKLIDSFPTNVDVVLSILVLQHVENPQREIDNLINSLKPNGYLVLLNEQKRMIPTGVKNGYIDWSDDGFDVQSELSKRLSHISTTPYINPDKNVVIYRKK